MAYITFKNIATSGDLGSQIMQYWALYAVAKENNKTVVFPESMLNRGFGFKFHKALDVQLDLKYDSFFNDFVSLKMNQKLKRDPSVFELKTDTNYNIDELFYLYRYWYPKYAEDISNMPWNKHCESISAKKYKEIAVNDKELVSIHVRRGDYLLPQHSHFCCLDTDYYSKAIQPFVENFDKYHFVVFSNDIQWCKENLIEGEMVTFVEPSEDYIDLVLMSMCDHNVIANSTYSWVAAYKNKNKNKVVVCPTNYVKQDSPVSFINGNYYPSDWKNIDNYA